MITFLGNFTNAMKDFSTEKLERLRKYPEVSDILDTAKFKLSKVGNDFKLEIQLGNDLRCSQVGNDFYEIVTDAVEKLDGQIRRYRTNKIFNKRHKNSNEEEFEEFSILTEKLVILNEMSENEAIARMDALDFDFYVYKDIDNDATASLVYKKINGGFGKIVYK